MALLLSLSASVANGQPGKVFCVPGAPEDCSVDLVPGMESPIKGTLFSPTLAAWYIVQTADIDASIDRAVAHSTEVFGIRLKHSEEQCTVKTDNLKERISDRDETIDNLSGVHRSPMLWTGVGALIVSVVWAIVRITDKGIDNAFAGATP